jgi:hypothetical protein
MEWLIVLLVLAGLWWMLSSKGHGPARATTPRRSEYDDVAEDLSAKQRALEANRQWLDERWRMAESEKAAGSLKHFPHWFFDKATDRQRERLTRDGVKVSGNATKGQLSDIIGLFVEPGSEELEKLKFYEVRLKGALRNQTRARHELATLASDPEKERAWLMRPATAMQKEFYRFIGEKPPAGLTAEQAEARMLAVLDEMPDAQQNEWYEYEHLVDMFSDSEFRADVEIRKPTLGDIRAAMMALKAAGGAFDDPYDVADKLLEIKPALERESRN